MINRVFLLGNVGNSTKIITTSAGRPAALFSLATDRYYRSGGERHEVTEWHRCSLWNNTVPAFQEHVATGTRLFIEGELRTSRYEDDQGTARYRTEVRVLRWYRLSPKPSTDEAEEAREVEEIEAALDAGATDPATPEPDAPIDPAPTAA